MASKVASALGLAVALAGGYRPRASREVPSSTVDPQTAPVAYALATASVHERVMLAYVGGLLLAVLGGDGPGRVRACVTLLVIFGLVVGGLVGVRTRRWPLWLRGLLARLLVPFVLLGTFLQLHVILPAARGERACDALLLQLDLRVFGFEPAVA